MEPWTRLESTPHRGFAGLGRMREPVITYVTHFEPLEREALGDLTATVSEALMGRARSAPKDELAEMMGMPSGHREAPDDPALARLLPAFEESEHEDFEGDAAMLRSFHETDIIREQLLSLRVINDALGPDGGVDVCVDEADISSWLKALNIIRLYVAHSDLVDNGVEEERRSLVEWLAFAQDSLLDAVMGAPGYGDDHVNDSEKY